MEFVSENMFPAPEEDSDRLAERSLLVECTTTIYRRRARALYSHFLVGSLALTLAWSGTARASTVGLVVLLFLYTMVGIVTTGRFNTRPPEWPAIRRWAQALYVMLVGLGLLYNAIFMNLAHHGVPRAMDYLLLIQALFCAGAVASYQHLRGLAMAFIVAASVPQVVYHLADGSSSGRFTALLLLIFMVFMSQIGFSLHWDAMKTVTLTRQLQVAKEEAESLARTDALTNLANRRAFFEIGEALLATSHRQEEPLSVMVLDIDRFKTINDQFGHRAGDATIISVAEVLRDTARASDVVGRLGGDEFAILLPATTAEHAVDLADRVRRTLREISRFASAMEAVTTSIGVAERRASDTSLDHLVERADRALYEAKDGGRDRTSLAAT